MTETDLLQVGGRVWFPGYGNGVVKTVGDLFVWIDWDNGGLLHHRPADIVDHLEPARQ